MRPIDADSIDFSKYNNVYKAIESTPTLEVVPITVLDTIRAEITTLQNRCYALTKGTMCAFCTYICKYKSETEGT